MRWRRRAFSVLVAALAGVPFAATAAHADSIVYVKDGNVWRAAPDGSGAAQLTTSGGLVAPSQADDGTIVATDEYGGESCRRPIARLSPDGAQATRVDVLGPVGPGLSTLGPWYPEISPDATRVAFGETLINSGSWSALCQPLYTDPFTSSISREHVKVVDAQTGATIGLIAPQASLWAPSWLSDGRLLVFAPYNRFAPQVGVGNPGEEPASWFSDPLEDPNDPNAFLTRAAITDGEVSRDGSSIAYIRGDNSPAPRALPTIQVASVAGFAAPPTVRCDIPVSGAPVANPSWSPDGRALAWSEPDGIHTTTIAPGPGPCAAEPRLIVAGGSHPDWGPYTAPAASSIAPPAGASTAVARLRAPRSVARKLLLRRGLSARVTCSQPCRITARLTTKGKRAVVVGRASGRLSKAGTKKLRVRLLPTARRRVARGAKLRLRISAVPGGTRTATVTVS
jgi:Tol biopolymer transport system component